MIGIYLSGCIQEVGEMTPKVPLQDELYIVEEMDDKKTQTERIVDPKRGDTSQQSMLP